MKTEPIRFSPWHLELVFTVSTFYISCESVAWEMLDSCLPQTRQLTEKEGRRRCREQE
jgi:hypothetical protein